MSCSLGKKVMDHKVHDSDRQLSYASLTATRLAFGLQQVCIARCHFPVCRWFGWADMVSLFNRLFSPSSPSSFSRKSFLFSIPLNYCSTFPRTSSFSKPSLPSPLSLGTSDMQLDFVLTRGSSPSNTSESPLSGQSLITSSFTGNAEANTSFCLLILASASLLELLLHCRFATIVKLHAQSMTLSLFTPPLLFTSLRPPNSELSHSCPAHQL